MDSLLDLERYPLNYPESGDYRSLVRQCRHDLRRDGMFNLAELVPVQALIGAVHRIAPLLAEKAFIHRRWHNIYFRREIEGLPADHPALRLCETVNHTLCADQLAGNLVMRLHDYAPLTRFLAEVMGKTTLYPMADPLARVNVMAYREGEALNWHFDRSEFTTTLLLQAPEAGGVFQYRTDLRSDHDPNYEGVAKLLAGTDPEVRELHLSAGSLNVFRGKNTAHRVTPVEGERERIIAVLSYYERPGVVFSDEERVGFYGRAA